MENLEQAIIDYANNLLKSYSDTFRSKGIVIKEYPRIDAPSDSYREFVFTLWNENEKDLLVVEFPTFIRGKAYCSTSQAENWIKDDIEDFIH